MHIVLLAHQGGWDEALFVLGPLVFIVWLLRLAKARAARAQEPPTPTDTDHHVAVDEVPEP